MSFQQDCRPRSDRVSCIGGLADGDDRGSARDRTGRRGGLAGGGQAGRSDPREADLTALNLSPVLETPVRNTVPNLVYAGSGHEVVTVMVAGQVLVRDGEVLRVDEAAVRAEAQVQAEVARRVAADSVHRDMALLKAMEAGQL